MLYVDPDDIPYERDPVLRTNDIIVVRSGAYTADSAIVPVKYDGAITGYDMVVRVTKCNPFYISYALLSDIVLINQLYLKKMRAAQPHLNAEELGETLFLVPKNKHEQDKTVLYLDNISNKINNLVQKIQSQITLLREYRSALISGVVTGKIDVRDFLIEAPNG